MQSMVTNSSASETDPVNNDLGPLAWVLDELRKSLESASKALKRFSSAAEAAHGSDLASLDASQLRMARQQLHQAVGALEMVGLAGPAVVLRSMESAVQKFVQQPEFCTQDSAAKIEYAGFALTEYLEGILAEKPVSAVSLFPQYRDVQTLIRADRIHPADLWPYEWRWIELQHSLNIQPLEYDTASRSAMDQSTLQLMKGKAPQSALNLRDLSLGFSVQQTEQQPKIFWLVAAAYFEAVALDLLGSDIYVRRAASRILLQCASLTRGNTSISERLALDLLFFCAQAVPSQGADGLILSTVRNAYGLTKFKPVNYELVQFGRFDPALLAQARKRIVAAKEAWSLFCAGELSKAKSVADQFSLVADSLRKLHPPSELLAHALMQAVDITLQTGAAPSIHMAMEVATSVLYLEAVFEDLDPNDAQLVQKTASLAKRLEGVRAGGELQPLENWMEDLYRRVSDKHTMGSIVGELRVSLGELEKSLDHFFRNPQDKTVLRTVPVQLSNMRGVLSVLGLDQASKAVLRMRTSIEQLLDTEIDEQSVQATETFEHLGDNLGALSFLIDMLSYQPALAKKLFVYNEEKGELRPLVGRSQSNDSPASGVMVQNDNLLSHSSLPAIAEQDLDGFESIPDHPLDVDSVPVLDFDRNEHLEFTDPPISPLAESTVQAVAFGEFAALDSALFQVPVIKAELPTEIDFEEEDLRDIFLEEAREVLGNARRAIEVLVADAADSESLTILRRAFHTLKGSSRMVGLAEFGEAAWALEQLLNGWLADQKRASKEFRTLSSEVVSGFSQWVDAIAEQQDTLWSSTPFLISTEAMRLEGRYSVLELPVKASESYVPLSAVAGHFSYSDPLPVVQEFTDALTEASISQGIVLPVEAEVLDFDLLFGAVPVSRAEHDLLPSPSFVDEPVSQAELLKFGFGQEESQPESAMPEVEPVSQLKTLTDAVEPEGVVSLPDEPVALEPVRAELEPDIIPLQKIELEKDGQSSLLPLFESDNTGDETVRVIDGLRIGIPLYNVYLNEADEWSRRLVNEIAEWALEGRQPVSLSTVALAHSLVGSSATVGFHALSDMARSLEQALQASHHHHSHGASSYGQLFVDASEDIRRLLHQFAAGFLKQPRPDILERLNQLEFVDSVLMESSDDDGFYFLAEAGLLDDGASALPLLPAADSSVQTSFDIEAISLIEAESAPEDSVPAIVDAEVVQSRLQPLKVSRTPRVLVKFEEDDDEIDAVDAIDPDLFPIFEEECAELMPRLGSALRQWAMQAGDVGARLEVLRILHTLKGSARLAGALRLGEMAHRFESEISFVGTDGAANQEFDSLLNRFDGMQANFDLLRRPELPPSLVDAVEAADPAAELPSSAVSVPQEKTVSSTISTKLAVEDCLDDAANIPLVAASNDSAKAAIPAPQAMVMRPLRQAAAASIRVRTQLLDRMVNQAGEVMITRSRLEAEIGQLRNSLSDMGSNLTRLRQQLRDIELQAESQMQSRLALAKEDQAGFDPLEFDRFTRVQELTRMMAESVSDVATVQRTLQRTVEATEDDLIIQGRQTRELQRDLLRTRMVEFEGMSERLYRVVRQVSKETGKQVRLDLLGGNLEMDRGTLDRMMPAFEHLLRNCVTHGIESPQLRADAGKDPVGLITIHLRQEGNDVSVDFSDDGGGLNLQRIREKALSSGLLTANQLDDDQAAAELIFLPGFSTADQITELAGRGIGMDVVRSEVNALGGRIETSTAFGKGTHFKLVLPLTTAVTQVVIIRSGNLSVGVPSNVVETVRRVSAKELQQAYSSGTLDVGGEAVPFFWSGALLQASQSSSEMQTKNMFVVIFRSAAQRVALHVDEVLGNREVVVKNLGPQLSHLPGLAGMSVLPSGSVVLIYNLVALAVVYGQQARAWSAEHAVELQNRADSGHASLNVKMLKPAKPAVPLILVVDDSITVRRVTQRLLMREGFRVAMAADGLQALERLQEEVPALVLSDIEMPRMDGFDLARNIRADARLKVLPIIMITSRIAEKHREHAEELGVNHYLGKPYSEDELIRLVRQYCATEAVIAV